MDGIAPGLKNDRAGQLAFLLSTCHRLMVYPQDANGRERALAMLARADVTPQDGDSPLAAALVKEARAHLEELAYRLEAPGYPAVYIGAVAARLCQTLTLLQSQAPASDRASESTAGAGRGWSDAPST